MWSCVNVVTVLKEYCGWYYSWNVYCEVCALLWIIIPKQTILCLYFWVVCVFIMKDDEDCLWFAWVCWSLSWNPHHCWPFWHPFGDWFVQLSVLVTLFPFVSCMFHYLGVIGLDLRISRIILGWSLTRALSWWFASCPLYIYIYTHISYIPFKLKGPVAGCRSWFGFECVLQEDAAIKYLFIPIITSYRHKGSTICFTLLVSIPCWHNLWFLRFFGGCWRLPGLRMVASYVTNQCWLLTLHKIATFHCPFDLHGKQQHCDALGVADHMQASLEMVAWLRSWVSPKSFGCTAIVRPPAFTIKQVVSDIDRPLFIHR